MKCFVCEETPETKPCICYSFFWVGLEFDQRSNIVMVHSDCSCQIFITEARLLASNEKGVAIRFVRWESPRKFPSMLPSYLQVDCWNWWASCISDVGRTVLTGVLEGYLN
jgi:hypothetical protein